MTKKYVLVLTEAEREALIALVSNGWGDGDYIEGCGKSGPECETLRRVVGKVHGALPTIYQLVKACTRGGIR